MVLRHVSPGTPVIATIGRHIQESAHITTAVGTTEPAGFLRSETEHALTGIKAT